MAALPAALSFRFAFLGVGADFVSAFWAAHLLRCASAIAFRPAALMPPFLRAGGVGLAVPCPFGNSPRSSAICASSLLFCSSNPKMAASTISLVSLSVGILITFCHGKVLTESVSYKPRCRIALSRKRSLGARRLRIAERFAEIAARPCVDRNGREKSNSRAIRGPSQPTSGELRF